MADKKKVLVGMSGGVDSSAAALLLLEMGYDVTGCTLRLYDNEAAGVSAEGGCCSLADVQDAKSVCRRLGIDHITLNFTGYFGKYVMKPFADSYIKGEIPNPCIECNRHIKFDLMLKRAELLGFDYIATGHYAGVIYKDGRYRLVRPRDRKKDQTYVLCCLTQSQLSRVIFPLSVYDKQEIRRIAEEHGFVNSDKPDSQDICFVPGGDYVDFIKRYAGYEPVPGDFISPAGDVMGRHGGYIRYTIGQRKGLGAAFGRPVYVTGKDIAANTVTLSDSLLTADEIYLRDMNIIDMEYITESVRVQAKIRYNSPEQAAVIYPPDDRGLYRVTFSEPVTNPTAGQYCALYIDDRVLGGGIITEISRRHMI